jgi:hypothetical protein
MGEWLLSQRDGTIVARHEVPGIMENRPRPSGTVEVIVSPVAPASGHAQVFAGVSKASRFTSLVPGGTDWCISETVSVGHGEAPLFYLWEAILASTPPKIYFRGFFRNSSERSSASFAASAL